MSESFRQRRQRREQEEVNRLLATPEADLAFLKLCNAFHDFGEAIRPAVEAASEEEYKRAFARSIALKLMREAEGEGWKLISPLEVS